jgi:hypothetical protein
LHGAYPGQRHRQARQPGVVQTSIRGRERRGYIERGQALYTQLVNTLREQITSGPHIRTNDQGEDDRHV